MEVLHQYWIQWLASNAIAVLLLITAVMRPRWARLLLVLLFAWACWLNYTTAHQNPEDYLNYASLTPFNWLRDFINGWFKEHITWVVTLISFGQGLIALGLILKGWWVRTACIGAMIFLIAITPLGIGAGFPSSVIAAIAAYFVLKKDTHAYLWMWSR